MTQKGQNRGHCRWPYQNPWPIWVAYIVVIAIYFFILAGCGGSPGAGAPVGAQGQPPAPIAAPAPPPEPVTVFMGDSITYRWQTAEYAPAPGEALPAYIIDVGIPGQMSFQMLDRFQHDVLDKHPAIVHILAGTNDCIEAAEDQGGTGATPDFQYVREMVIEAQAAGIRVIVGTVPPMAPTHPQWVTIGLAWNDEVRAEAKTYGYEVVDYWAATTDHGAQITADFLADTTHPSPAGYAAMWAAVAPHLN